MKVDVHRMGSVSVISPRGAIAQDDVVTFAHHVEDQRVKSNGRMVLDLSQVAYIDSLGLNTLLDLCDRQRDAGQTMRVAAVQELCREILELTQVSDGLDIFDTTENAVRSFL